MKTAAIIPAYNESQRVTQVVRATSEHVDVVAVVDDGSTDSTTDEAQSAGATVLKLPVNIGYGGALQAGYRWAMSKGIEALVQLDADGQHDPHDIPALLKPVIEDRCDLALGSRFLKQNSWQATFSRRLGMKFFSLLIRIFSGRRITDPTTGFQAMNRRVIERVAGGAYPDDFPDADVIVMLLRERFRIEEVGVVMKPPPAGKSMHSGLKPLYYIVKMTLAILVVAMRRNEGGGGS